FSWPRIVVAGLLSCKVAARGVARSRGRDVRRATLQPRNSATLETARHRDLATPKKTRPTGRAYIHRNNRPIETLRLALQRERGSFSNLVHGGTPIRPLYRGLGPRWARS